MKPACRSRSHYNLSKMGEVLNLQFGQGDELHLLDLYPAAGRIWVELLFHSFQLLNFIASRHKENLMDSSNLAIVLTPSIMPLPAAASAQRLDHHVALVKVTNYSL